MPLVQSMSPHSDWYAALSVRGVSGTRTEPETTAHETCMNGGKRLLRAVPNRLDDMIFVLAQHEKLLVKCAYRFWISERITAP